LLSMPQAKVIEKVIVKTITEPRKKILGLFWQNVLGIT
jgi:hypothetical protein